MKFKKLVLSVAILALFNITYTKAAQLTGTLKKIKTSGTVTIGHRESSIPFSYYNDKQEVIGYSQEYSNLIVDMIKKELGIPDLKVKYLPITSKTRIPLLQNGSYDFECGSTTNNVSRQQQVGFSNTIFIVGTRFLVKSNSNINDLNDLKGKNVVVTSGTTSEIKLNQLNDSEKLGIRLITPKDHSDAFRTLESGRATAFLMDDALLAGERARAKKPEGWKIVGTPLSHEAYACMMRKGDYKFIELANLAIYNAQKSGAALEFYNRWFKSPIPPSELNLNFDLTPEMSELFQNPNDKALD